MRKNWPTTETDRVPLGTLYRIIDAADQERQRAERERKKRESAAALRR